MQGIFLSFLYSNLQPAENEKQKKSFKLLKFNLQISKINQIMFYYKSHLREIW